MNNNIGPVWAEINLKNLGHNVKEIKKILPKDTLFAAVIKANAYGHGAIEVSQTLLDNGVDWFAVANLTEALELRKAHKKIPILILDYVAKNNFSDVIENDFIQTIYSHSQARGFSQKATHLGKKVKFHIKIDTGLGRLGFRNEEKAIQEIKKISSLPNVVVEGIFTHFAVADRKDKSFTIDQLKKFREICDRLERKGIIIPIKHAANSAAVIDLPQTHLNLVRPGIMLYGLYPSNEVKKENINLKEVMTLKAKISYTKELETGWGVGYGLIYKTSKRTKIAILPIGYADGFTRLLTGKAQVLVKGKKVPVIGRICMDHCMIDVTDLDVTEGEEVILFGSDGLNKISIDELAKKIGTINYEIICMVREKIPRVYIK